MLIRSVVACVWFLTLGVQQAKLAELESSQELKTTRKSISLDGVWDFSYDPREIGQSEGWFKPEARLPEKIRVPGCAQAEHHASSGMSEEQYRKFHESHGEFMMDLKYPTLAPAWQRTRFVVPAEWQGQEVWLHLGGVNPAADLWLNGTKLASTVSARTPLRYCLTGLCRFGIENVLVIRTYWPEGPRLDGLFTYVLGFSGLYRSVRIEAAPAVHFKQVQVSTSFTPPSATIRFLLSGDISHRGDLRVKCKIAGFSHKQRYESEVVLDPAASPRTGQSMNIPMPEAVAWSPDHPGLYEARLSLVSSESQLDCAVVRFGLREIRCVGLRVLLNGAPVYLRGASDDHIYLHTVCPPASKEFYLERLKRARRFGFNYAKSCMELFTEEFLDAADEVGLMVCMEMPFGLTGKYRTAIREEMPVEYGDLYRRELENIVRASRNHPSVVLYSMISEFGIGGMNERAFRLFCQELPATAKRLHPGALVMDITCSGDWTGKPRRGPRVTDLIEDVAGDQFNQEPLSYPIQGSYDQLDRPFLLHEYNWWTSLPEPSLKGRYDHLPCRLNGVPEMEKAASDAGLTDQLPRFVDNSRRLKRLLQKSGLELARREARISGYHFWLIQGFSWCQEGVFNEFYEEPEDISAEEFRGFNGDTVLLLDDGNRRVFECGQPAVLGCEVSHFGPQPLADPRVRWQLLKAANAVAEGSLKLKSIECGTLTRSQPLGLVMPAATKPSEYDLRLVLHDGSREISRNHWTLWAVPRRQEGPWTRDIATDLPWLAKAYPSMKSLDPRSPAGKVVVTRQLTDALIDYVDRGGRLVLLSDGAILDYRPGVEYRPGQMLDQDWQNSFTRLFRSPPWNLGAHGNMGTVIADHPALDQFPHRGWCDLQFLHLISGAYPIVLEPYRPQRIEPIVRSIGHKNTMVDKCYLFEVCIGRGALLATCFRVAATYETYPESKYLVDVLLTYAAASSFQPKASVSREAFAATAVRRK